MDLLDVEELIDKKFYDLKDEIDEKFYVLEKHINSRLDNIVDRLNQIEERMQNMF